MIYKVNKAKVILDVVTVVTGLVFLAIQKRNERKNNFVLNTLDQLEKK